MIILFEMTNDYRIILPLMLATVVSTLVSQQIDRQSVYTRKLTRRKYIHEKLDEYVVNLRKNEFPVEVYEDKLIELAQQEADMVKQLSDAELLAICLRSGMRGRSALDLARDALGNLGSLSRLFASELGIDGETNTGDK